MAEKITAPQSVYLHRPGEEAVSLEQLLTAARQCHQKQAFSNAFEYLDLAVTQLLSTPSTLLARLEPLLSEITSFQNGLLENDKCAEVTEWICPSAQGLLGRLIEHAKGDVGVAQCLIPLLEAVPPDGKRALIELRLSHLERAYHLAKLHQIDAQGRLLNALGTSYLRLGELLPVEKCYEGAFRQAAFCFNILQELLPNHADAEDLISSVESRYLRRLLPCFEALADHIKMELWSHRTPLHFTHARRLAEIALEYGEVEIARTLYWECVRYSEQQALPVLGSIRARHLELSLDSPKPTASPSWQRNRQILHWIRSLTTHLFQKISGSPSPPLAPPPKDFTLAAVEVLKHAGLIGEGSTAFDSSDILQGAVQDVHTIQQLHGQMIIQFVATLYAQAVAFFGKPPCRYALVGLGSLPRGEMSPFSDLDAIVIVEKEGEAVTEYFQRVGSYFDLLFLNLGETHCHFAGHEHLKDCFSLDPAMLHPSRTIATPAQLIAQVKKEASFLVGGGDLDPIRNALRLPCRIAGSEDLYGTYRAQLGALLLQKEVARGMGSALLSRWSAPEPFGCFFDAKQDLYRPLTLLIDGLAVRCAVNATRTTERLDGLSRYLPHHFIALCRRGLRLACQLRIKAQLHHGQESEKVDLEAKADRPSPLLLSFEEHQLFQQVTRLLFFGQLDFSEGLQEEAWAALEARYLKEMIDSGQIAEALEYGVPLEELSPELATSCLLVRGDFSRAEKTHRFEGAADSFDVNPFAAMTRAYAALPDSPELRALSGWLNLLKLQGGRAPLPDPPGTLFKGSLPARQAALWTYLTRLPLPLELRRRAWRLAYQCCRGAEHPPDSPAELFTALLPIANPTPTDLCYGDLLLGLRALLHKEHNTEIYRYLFYLFPHPLLARFLTEVTVAGLPQSFVNVLSHFPSPDGSRPLAALPTPTLSMKSLCGESNVSIEGVDFESSLLSPEAAAFFGRLLKGIKGPYGRHSVAEFGGFFWKLRPEFPGRERAYTSLVRRVTGEAFPPHELLCITADGQRHAVTLSAKVEGPSLQVLLDERPQVENLDFRHYCFGVLMTLVALPEDAKADNFVVYRPTPESPVQLIDVDRERVFFSAMKHVLLGRSAIQCKSILLCLDQMREPIDPSVRDEFLALHPTALFGGWLDEIERHNGRVREMFSQEEINAFLGADRNSELLFFLEPSQRKDVNGHINRRGRLFGLYDRLCRLQDFLRREPAATLIDMLLHIEPDLGALYQAELEKQKPAIRRFCDLTKGQYRRIAGTTVSITTSKLPSTHLSVEEYQRHGWSIDSARDDLRRIVQAGSTLEDLTADLVEGEGLTLKGLDLPEVSDRVVGQLHWGQMGTPLQKEVLRRITGLRFSKLSLTGCRVLSNRALKALLRHSPDLHSLNLRRASGITSLDYLPEYCPRIRKLNIDGLSTLRTFAGGRLSSAAIVLPELVALDISNCPSLDRFALETPNLRHLRVHKLRPKAKLFKLACGQIAFLDTSFAVLPRALRWCTPRQMRMGDHLLTILKEFSPVDIPGITNIRGRKDRWKREWDFVGYGTGRLGFQINLLPPRILNHGTFSVSIRKNQTKSTYFFRPFDPAIDTLDVLQSVAKRNANLVTLDLSFHKDEVTDEFIEMLVSTAHRLRWLNLTGCHRLTDRSLLLISQFCQNLSHLNLSFCGQFSGTAIEQLTACANLTHLILDHCIQVTAATANAFLKPGEGTALFKAGRTLKSLSLKNCRLGWSRHDRRPLSLKELEAEDANIELSHHPFSISRILKDYCKEEHILSKLVLLDSDLTTEPELIDKSYLNYRLFGKTIRETLAQVYHLDIGSKAPKDQAKPPRTLPRNRYARRKKAWPPSQVKRPTENLVDDKFISTYPGFSDRLVALYLRSFFGFSDETIGLLAARCPNLITVSGPREPPPRPLAERYVSLSTHTAPIRQTHPPYPLSSVQTNRTLSLISAPEKSPLLFYAHVSVCTYASPKL